jgi:hypothetical protein
MGVAFMTCAFSVRPKATQEMAVYKGTPRHTSVIVPSPIGRLLLGYATRVIPNKRTVKLRYTEDSRASPTCRFVRSFR